MVKILRQMVTMRTKAGWEDAPPRFDPDGIQRIQYNGDGKVHLDLSGTIAKAYLKELSISEARLLIRALTEGVNVW